MRIRGPWIPAGIFLLALAVRLFYLREVRDLPLVRVPLGDARSYYEWAGRIAAGDWIGREVFYQAPLYPYFLGVIRALGGGLAAIRVIQAFAGAAAALLLYRAGSAFAGRAAGIVAGAGLAIYAPAIFYDGLIQKTVLDSLLMAWLLVLIAACRIRPRERSWFLTGIALALLCLSRENALLLAPVLLLWIELRFRDHARPPRLRWAAALALGMAIVLLPVGVRNYAVGRTFALTTAQLGPNLYIGNNPRANGSYVPLRPNREDPSFERADATELAEAAAGHALSAGEVSRYWVGRTLAFVRDQPGRWLYVSARKLLLLVNDVELTDTEDYYLYRRESALLGGLGTVSRFGVLLPLFLAALAGGAARRRELRILHVLLGTLAIAMAAFYVFGRYRLSLVPPMLVIAGAGIPAWRERDRLSPGASGRAATFALPALLALAGVILAWLPLTSRSRQESAGWTNMAAAAASLGRLGDAVIYARRALVISPGSAGAHYQLGNALAMSGHADEAAAELESVLRADPLHTDAMNSLGLLLQGQGHKEEAVAQFRNALHAQPDFLDARMNLANALSELGRFDEARDLCKEAARERPTDGKIYSNLGSIQLRAGDYAGAIPSFEHALALDSTLAYAELGLALAIQGRGEPGAPAEAEAHLRRAFTRDPTDSRAAFELVKNLLAQGKTGDILPVLETARASGHASPDWYLKTGRELASRGYRRDAIRVLEAGHAFDPGNAEMTAALNEIRDDHAAAGGAGNRPGAGSGARGGPPRSPPPIRAP